MVAGTFYIFESPSATISTLEYGMPSSNLAIMYDDPTRPGKSALPHWPLFILSVLSSVFPAEVVSLCYRFDYALFRSHSVTFGATGEIEDVLTNFVADAELPSLDHADVRKRSLFLPIAQKAPLATTAREAAFVPDTGFRLPSFPKAYYATAVVSWAVATAGTSALLATYVPHGDVEFWQAVQAVLALSSLPAMVAAILLVAIVRGEFIHVWRYSEAWTASRGPAGQRDKECDEALTDGGV